MKLGLKRSLIGVSIGVAVIGVAIIGYGWYLYNSVKDTADKIYEPIPPQEYVSKDPDVNPSLDELIAQGHPFTVMVMGVDQRDNDPGRSDTLIVLGVNPAKKSILMFNIPRDTRTEIVGHGTTDKINHAYAFGGAEMSKATVEQFLDYPIDYYIRINMEGFAKMIDLIGGVEVNNPFSFDYGGYVFNKGPLELDGEKALLYSRMRYDDPRGDFGRNERQRDIIKNVMKSALKFSNITQIERLLAQLGTSVKTNITFDEMKTFLKDYRADLEKIDTVEITGKGETINKIWYYIVSEDERTKIHDLLKNQLNESVPS